MQTSPTMMNPFRIFSDPSRINKESFVPSNLNETNLPIMQQIGEVS